MSFFDWKWTCQLNTGKAALIKCLCRIFFHLLVCRRSRSIFTGLFFRLFLLCNWVSRAKISCISPSPFYFHGTKMPFPSNGISRNPSLPFNVRSLPETSWWIRSVFVVVSSSVPSFWLRKRERRMRANRKTNMKFVLCNTQDLSIHLVSLSRGTIFVHVVQWHTHTRTQLLVLTLKACIESQ